MSRFRWFQWPSLCARFNSLLPHRDVGAHPFFDDLGLRKLRLRQHLFKLRPRVGIRISIVLNAIFVRSRFTVVRPISSTARLTSYGRASLLRSISNARPPGRSTRHISRNAPTRSAKFLKAARHSRKSKLFFGNGMFDAEPCLKSTRTPCPVSPSPQPSSRTCGSGPSP